MNDYFIWNGVNSTTKGIYVLEQPPIIIPEERITFTDVPGRSGSLATTEGEDVYNDITLPFKCIIRNTENIDAVIAFLHGAGTLSYPVRSGGHYEARIVNQIPLEKILRGNPHRSFTVNFRCKPLFLIDGTEDITLTTSGQFVSNPYSVTSEPVITVTGSGDITLMVGQYIILLEDIEGSITIDSRLQEAYSSDELQNGKMTGDFPKLVPGQNAISWTGDVTSVLVKPYWRSK